MKVSASVDQNTGELGSLYVQFSEEPVARTLALRDPDDPELLLDLDKNNGVRGMEVLSLALLKTICQAITKRLPAEYKSQVSELCEMA